MSRVLVIAVALLATIVAANEFGSFASRFNKVYSSPEEARYRQNIFYQNLLEIEAINGRNLGWKAGVNEWTDLTWEEFKGRFLMAPQECSATKGNHVMSGRAPNAPAIDWRQKGVVTPVKNQGSCGSCWSFSSTGAIESAWALKTGQLLFAAEQQLVDCAGNFNNDGCRGGLPSQAFQYIMWAGGIVQEKDYPYTARDGQCKFDRSKVAIRLANEVNITQGAEDELFDAVTHHGPVSVAYQVASDFRHYRDGVYDSTVCKSGPMDINHAVLAVGYNSTNTAVPYWIVKNSWGTSFGQQGYFWMVRDKNMCGIATCSSYPIAG